MGLGLGPNELLNLAKTEYLKRYSTKGKFAYCIIYLVINRDRTMRLDFKYPQDVHLAMRFIHKRPGGAKRGESISNIDIREITDILIPPYERKYYFDFIFWVLDITTGNYWATNLWTGQVCADLRYYLSEERKCQYSRIGKGLAEKYNMTFILGHVNLRTARLKSSSGIRRLIKYGWIPTISLFPQPYGEMVRIIESTNDMDQVDAAATSLFDSQVLDDILARWLKASLAKGRMDILSTAIERFKSNDFISCIHILIPQIEGLVNEHIRRKRCVPEEKSKERFKQFGNLVKAEKFNSRMTVYLCNILTSHLKHTFYQKWYPFPRKGRLYRGSPVAPQRHLISHGKTIKQYFTAANCLKLICVIDAIILLSLRRNEVKSTKKLKY
ncbi:MAG: hypothetical protein A2Z75_03270 [Chloroflexi bacterium RBG_13_50_10]|nr:MAG: hypothetical protein A2Z75_03270 [Chloroflexi bacterium RBG_13_50_10]